MGRSPVFLNREVIIQEWFRTLEYLQDFIKILIRRTHK